MSEQPIAGHFFEEQPDWALTIAALVWCRPECSSIEMDATLAYAFADELRKERSHYAEQCRELEARMTQYFSAGGFWNPEAMDHSAVSDLLYDVRDLLRTISG